MSEVGTLRGDAATTSQRCAEVVINDVIERLRGETDGARVEAVVGRLKSGGRIDYDAEWQSFAVAYLLINYRKTLELLRALRLPAVVRVLDVGCGLGAASLALLTVAAEQRLRVPHVTLFDRSAAQLGSAVRGLSDAAEALGIDTKFDVECADIAGAPIRSDHTVILCSHVLGEQPKSQVGPVFDALVESVPPGGVFVAIERAEEQVWDNPTFVSVYSPEARSGSLSVSAPAPVGPRGRNRSWGASWCILEQPELWIRQLIKNYFLAWETRNVDLLPCIFSPEAVYHEKPFAEPLAGLEQIRRYWADRVAVQEDIHIDVSRLAFSLLAATVTWCARFTIDGSHRTVAGLMTLEFDPLRRRITALREIFRTSSVG